MKCTKRLVFERTVNFTNLVSEFHKSFFSAYKHYMKMPSFLKFNKKKYLRKTRPREMLYGEQTYAHILPDIANFVSDQGLH